MPIIVNLDVMMAKRKISSGDLAEKIDITPANLSILKTGKAKAVYLSNKKSFSLHWRKYAKFWTASPVIYLSTQRKNELSVCLEMGLKRCFNHSEGCERDTSSRGGKIKSNKNWHFPLLIGFPLEMT